MSDLIKANKPQSKSEIRIWDFDFNDDLKVGVTVTGAVATHIPPSGNATTPVVGSVVNNVVPVKLGPLGVTGTHYLDVLADLSDGEKSNMRLKILVNY